MVSKILVACMCLGFGVSVYAQNSVDKVIPCHTSEAMEKALTQDPNLKAKYNLIQSQMDIEYQTALEEQNAMKKVAATVYTVPVVFHILHQNGPENIDDSQIIAALDQINKDYRKGGADVASINPSFSSIYKDAEIQFVLAKRDPQGNCTSGIIRHYDANTNWDEGNVAAYAYSGSAAGRWSNSKYLNIYIVKCIASSGSPCPAVSTVLVGYTYLPGSSPGSAADAIVYRYDYLPGLKARSLSHEMGHWLNLKHTWGDGSVASACGDDGVTDTPTTEGYFSTCPGGNTGPFSGCAVKENIENFMDYSSCPRMFTQNQVTRMRTALTSSSGGRNNLWSTTNLAFTGLSATYTCMPVADLKSNKLAGCVGDAITFTSLSQVGASGSLAWAFEGGSPNVSTVSAPTVTYPSAGTYSVSLKATNASGSNTINKVSYITISKGLAWVTAPDVYNFDDFYGVPSVFTVKNYDPGTIAWDYYASGGAISTSASMFLHNFAQTNPANNMDAFETPIYNFENTTNVSLSYYYAYAKNASTQIDTFRVQYSFDCGGNWSNIIGVPSAVSMAANSGGVKTTDYIPATSDWKQTIIASSLLSSLNNKPSVKFRFYFKSDPTLSKSNNIYIDQINLSGVVGLNELENTIGLTIYPNPTNSSSIVDFNLYNNEKVNISVTDLMGRVLESNPVSPNNNHVTYTINKNNELAKGVYLVHIDVNGQEVSKKLIIN